MCTIQKIQYLIDRTTVCPELFGHWRFSETSDPIVKIPKGVHSYMQKYTFDPFPNLKAIKAADDWEKGWKQFFELNFWTVGPILLELWYKAHIWNEIFDNKNFAWGCVIADLGSSHLDIIHFDGI